MATAWLFWVLSGQAKSLERGEFELGSERQDGASHAKIKIRVNCSGKRNSQCKGPEVGTGLPFWRGREEVSVSRMWQLRARVP